MQHAHYQLVQRQASNPVSVPTVEGISGGETATSGNNFGTSLLVGTAGPSTATSVTNPLVPGVATLTVTSSSTYTQTGTTSSSSHSSASVSTGAVMGITVGVFLVVIGAMFAIYTYFKKRTASQARHTGARGRPPAVRGAEGARDPGKDKQWSEKGSSDDGASKNKPPLGPGISPRGKTPESGKFPLFEKEPSVRTVSDEKANASDNHTFDPSSMPNFAQYHSDFAQEEGSPVVSWDGHSGDPLLSLRGSTSDTMSPTTVTARQTPRPTDSAQHRWESAEVVMMDGPTAERPSVSSDASHSQNPFLDSAASRQSTGGSGSDTRTGSNPFFSAGQHNPFSDRSSRSRKSSVSTAKRSRSNSVSSGGTVRPGTGGEAALLSIIAALESPPAVPDDQTLRTSVTTVTTSIYAPTESSVPMPTPKAF